MRVRLHFAVSENALPAEIVIKDFNGRLILKRSVYSGRNRLCFCIKDKNFIITVRPYSVNFYSQAVFIRAGNYNCITLRLNFAFTKRLPKWLQTFTLLDGNYSFPIKNATLFFDSVL